MPSKDQFIESRVEMEQILREETLGYLGLSVNDVPYVVPLNYAYLEGKIIFHCARQGKKLDVLRANPQVCFTVGRQYGEIVPHPQGAQCSADYDSVICFGEARIVEEIEERQRVLDVFNHRLQPAAEEISLEAASSCYAVEIKIVEMTGKQHKEGKNTLWGYRFSE